MSNNLTPLRLRDLTRELRLLPELTALVRQWRWRQPVPEPHEATPVLLLPGFGASDWMLEPLRRTLMQQGFRAYQWRQGRNHGDLRRLVPAVSERVKALVERHGGPIDAVGWSLGGYIVREVARDHPDWFRHLVTLGTPVAGGAKYTVFNGLYRRQGIDLDRAEARIEARYAVPLAVPVTAIYTRRDGIVAWRACIDERSPRVRHIEVSGSHTGLVYQPETLALVVRCLREGPPA